MRGQPHATLSPVYAPMAVPRISASRVSLEREIARGSRAVVFSGLYRDCECDAADGRCQHTRVVRLKVTPACCVVTLRTHGAASAAARWPRLVVKTHTGSNY